VEGVDRSRGRTQRGGSGIDSHPVLPIKTRRGPAMDRLFGGVALPDVFPVLRHLVMHLRDLSEHPLPATVRDGARVTLGALTGLEHVGVVLWGMAGRAINELSDNIFPDLTKYIGPAIPVCGGVIAWAYLSAANRLGVVDLFACEISTLCRVGTILETGKRFVEMYKKDKPLVDASQPALLEKHPTEKQSNRPDAFVSQEDYFPIFASNSRDLQALEALVVGHITEFYTYMKAVRDSLRRLAEMNAPHASMPGADASHPGPNQWHTTLANIIFLTFLGYESGRMAVLDLIEFEPTRAERTIVVLLTELTCYSFLCDHFLKYFGSRDVHYMRLKLRKAKYIDDIPKLYRRVTSSHGENDRDWIQARETAPELATRYKETFDETIETAIARIEEQERKEQERKKAAEDAPATPAQRPS
jgi:hypothetical protein